MHDQKKKEKTVLSPEEQATAAAEHKRVGMLYKAVLHTAKAHDYSMKTLDDTEKLLLAVPEAYTAYNCRRLALQTIWQNADAHAGSRTASEKADKNESAAEDATAGATVAAPAPELTRREWLCKELKLNTTVLLMNYKNYNAFVHRHWVFDQIEALAKAELIQSVEATKKAQETVTISTDGSTAPAASPSEATTAPTFSLLMQLLQKERVKCEQLLQLDERNFHAWNYRRWILAQERRAHVLAHTYLHPPSSPSVNAEEKRASCITSTAITFTRDEASELAYTTQKIRSNFSNYSAWHQRSLALKSAAARWQKHFARQGGDDENSRAEAHKALLNQLHEDVGFLEQAIYCDPNDQSAWFYAPFVLQLLQHARQTPAEAAKAVALKNAFVNAVIELIAEVDRVGNEDECYMPYYFLLDQLISLYTTANRGDGAEATASGAAVTHYTNALCRKVPSLAAAVNAGDSAPQQRHRCFCFLHARLCKADLLRKGLYDDMLAKVTKGETATDLTKRVSESKNQQTDAQSCR